jgi:hypothetical protein
MPLRITLELIPHGDESRKRIMGTLEIENTGDHPKHPVLAHYQYTMTGPCHGGGVDLWHSGTLKDVQRHRGYWAHVKDVFLAVDCEPQLVEP